MENAPSDIVKKLNCIKTKNASAHKIKTYIHAKDLFNFPEAIGLCFVLSTFLSKSLSTISLTMHPALLIKTEPKKNNAVYFK